MDFFTFSDSWFCRFSDALPFLFLDEVDSEFSTLTDRVDNPSSFVCVAQVSPVFLIVPCSCELDIVEFVMIEEPLQRPIIININHSHCMYFNCN